MNLDARKIVEARPFRGLVVGVILFAGVLAGVETDAAFVARHRGVLAVLDILVLAVFVLEIVLKMAAKAPRPLDYFRDGWNVFDFSIVAFCLLPVGGQFAAVLRLIRTLRLLRLVSALPKLQLLVGALFKSLSAMGYVTLLLALMFYIYAVTGIHLFGQVAPQSFGSLTLALMTLFQMLTLDNWSDLFTAARGAGPLAATVYFVSFILLGTMIMMNLFIGIIMNSMSEMHAEIDDQKQAGKKRAGKITPVAADLSAELLEVDGQLEALKSRLRELRSRLEAGNHRE